MPDAKPSASSGAPAHTAKVVIIGDEVLGGEVPDLNGPFILSVLAARGIRVLGLHVVPDDLEAVEPLLREASTAADRVVVTGGIGPTHDDITRLAVARALDRALVPHAGAVQRLASLFKRGATPEERAMSLLPEGAELLAAPGLVAFGFRVQNVLVFPGVPRLLEPLLRANLEQFGECAFERRELRTELREGLIAADLSALAREWPDLRWGSYPELTDRGWTLRLVLRGGDPTRVEAAFGALRNMVARFEKPS